MQEYLAAKRQFRKGFASANPGHPHLPAIDADIAMTAEAVRLLKPTSESPRLHPSLEGKVDRFTLRVGGRSREDLLREARGKGINITSYALSMIENTAFTTLPGEQDLELVIPRIGLLVPNPRGRYATTEEYGLARDQIGLGIVPSETALQYLLQNADQLKLGEFLWMDMKPIADRDGNPDVFGVEHGGDGLWLNSAWTKPSDEWDPEARFVSSLPQVTEA